MKPDEFEQQVARIFTTLSAGNEKVIWNDKFPDPDNPTQLRQVDITIRRDDTLTIVECRYHNRPQDVKWVEELYGRRVSLNATSIIGVSSSGFTKGALEKSRRLGVFLRSLTELSDEEINTWGHKTAVELAYIRFGDIFLRIIADDYVIFPKGLLRQGLRTSNGEEVSLRDLLSNCANMLAQQSVPEGPFSLVFRLKNVVLGYLPVNEVVLSANWQWVFKKVALPSVLVFNNAVEDGSDTTIVERSVVSRSEVHHAIERSVLIVDINDAPPDGCCLLRRVTSLFEKAVKINEVVLIGVGEPSSSECQYQVGIERKSSQAYQNLILKVGR
jgi:hypothetical protein